MNRLTLSAFAALALAISACGQVTPTTAYSANLTGTSGGSGQANLNLQGHTLTVLGTFSGLDAAATTASLYGPGAQESAATAAFPLTIDQVTNGARSGRISATVTLTDQQIDWLNNRQLYVGVHSSTSVVNGVVERLLR